MMRRIVPILLVIGLLQAAEDPLEAPAELKLFAKKAVAMQPGTYPKLKALVEAIHKPASLGGLGIEYDNSYTRSVEEVWRDRKANCLSLTALYVACATALDINVAYAEAQNTQRWRRVGNMIRYERHVVAVVRVPPNGDMVADFLPQLRKRWGIYIVSIIPEKRLRALFYSNRAVELMEAEKYPEALACAERSVQVDPDSGVGWNIRGVVARTQGEVAEAETYYRRALKLDSKDSSCIGNLEALMRETGREEEALRYRRMGIEVRQKDPYFNAFLAEEAINAGDLDEAQKRISVALKIQKFEPEFHLLQARIMILKGKLDDAIKSIELARRWALPQERERYDTKLAILKGKDAPGESKKEKTGDK